MTDGAGFLRSDMVTALKTSGCRDVIVPRKAEHDLTHEDQVRRFFADFRPDVVIHLAAIVGGIGANREHRGRFLAIT